MSIMMSRRAAWAGLSATASLSPWPTHAQSPPAVHKLKLGDAEIVIVSDGAMDVPAAFVLPGQDKGTIEKTFATVGQTFSGFRSEVNIAIVRIGKETILIDAGAGPDFMPTLGKAHERMEAAGLNPEAITKVLLTHAHPDHLWGVIDPLGGDTLFEKADHLMTAAEFDHWMNPDVHTRVPEAFQGIAQGTHRRLKTIASRIKTVAPGAEIAPGVEIVDTAGHTPGHVSVLVRSGGQQLLIGSDVLVQSVISFAEPDWHWGPDMDAAKAAAARRRILDRLAAERAQLLGYHFPWPGLGRVEKAGTAYRLVQG